MESLGYYPGCSLEGTGREYDISLRQVARELGVELVEIEDWNCCGASAAHCTNRNLALALPLRNIALAAEQGLESVLAPCAMCSNLLLAASHEVKNNEKLKWEVESVIELRLGSFPRVVNGVQFLLEKLERLEERVRRPLKNLRVACYYGCLLVRNPRVVAFDDAEHPMGMEKVVEALGAQTVDWPLKIECCGAGFTVSRREVVLELSHRILHDAKSEGAGVIVVACPMCQANLDMRQRRIERRFGEQYSLPVLYLTQLVGLALGLSARELGLRSHFVDTSPVVEAVSVGAE
jgi:heterodisulfide reductase subunit B